MGFDPINLTWDYSDNLKGHQSDPNVVRLARQHLQLSMDVDYLSQKVENLNLLVSVLSRLLTEKTDLTEETLLAELAKLENKKISQDDGIHCRNCKTILSHKARKRGRCIYCGLEIDEKDLDSSQEVQDLLGVITKEEQDTQSQGSKNPYFKRRTKE